MMNDPKSGRDQGHVTYFWNNGTDTRVPQNVFLVNNNSGISWSIFILFVPVETGRNTLQFSYLMVWWRHNCITSHVTKVCFIQLLVQVKYVEFEDMTFFCQKPVGMWNFFLTEDWLNNFLSRIRKEKQWTTFCISCQQLVRSNALR